MPSDFGREVSAASRNFRGVRLVLRRHAAHRVGDARPMKLEAVIRTGVVHSRGKAELCQCLVEQAAGMVAGKGAPGPVRAPEAWREADDQQLGVAVAEGWNRPVEPVGMEFLLGFSECRQTQAEAAIPCRQVGRGGAGHASSTGSARGR